MNLEELWACPQEWLVQSCFDGFVVLLEFFLQGKHRFPPPWLVAMQRYGPPPSYPNLKIPGLNNPIPEVFILSLHYWVFHWEYLQGCSFGYFVGGWGKPPVDERGRPLYGDVFGLEGGENTAKGPRDDEEMDQTFWGELESEEEESSEEVSCGHNKSKRLVLTKN